MPGWVFINGQYLREEEARIPVTDRGFLFGDGAFTTIRVREGKPDLFDAHVAQLRVQCHLLGFSLPNISQSHVEELIQKNQATEGTWRLKVIVTGGSGRALDLGERQGQQYLMLLHPYVVDTSEQRLALIPLQVSGILSKIKSLAYLERLWIKQLAMQQGFRDGIVTTEEGVLLETAFANIFWIVGNTFYYPDEALPYLKGVTLAATIDKAKKENKIIKPIKARLSDIPDDAAVYLCNAMMGIRPVVQIQDREFSIRPLEKYS